MEPQNNRNKAKWIICIVSVCILIYLGIQNIGVIAGAVSWIYGLFTPLLTGVALALILNVPMSFIESHLFQKCTKTIVVKLRRPIAYTMSLLVILGILVGVVWLVIPALFDVVNFFKDEVMNYANKISEYDFSNAPKNEFIDGLKKYIDSLNWNEILSTAMKKSSSLMNTAVGAISYLIDSIFNLFIAVIFSVYILFNKEKLKRNCKRMLNAWLPDKVSKYIIHVASVSNKIFHNFISGQTIEAIILGLLCTIGMLVLRIPYAPMIGALVGVTAIIPVVGALIGAIIGAFMILTVSPIKALIFLVFILVLQQLEGNVIYPKVIGSRVNLSAMWVLAAVTVGGALAGAIGMLIGVPSASVIYVLLREATQKREKAKKFSKKNKE